MASCRLAIFCSKPSHKFAMLSRAQELSSSYSWNILRDFRLKFSNDVWMAEVADVWSASDDWTTSTTSDWKSENWNKNKQNFFFKFYFNFAKCWLDTYTNDKTNYTHVRPTMRYTEFEGMTLFCDLKIYWMWRKECDAVSDVTDWTHLSYCKLYVSVRRQVDLS